ncbi:hypothetical protein IMZ11_41140 [Microtetraspora sp. AC03309]|uniref:hypothetical protein n=1 Tax=Microtetraspora sp. AC03309 TaxID=2779376 RepID=UPI001E433FCF|nr:hypothetical protein [Microtetraspora sp. AC03309]MCC5582024.1 hypothetical protein [Microtetraspora sp. AC03309]
MQTPRHFPQAADRPHPRSVGPAGWSGGVDVTRPRRTSPPPRRPDAAAAAAIRLQAALGDRHEIHADVHQGDQVAFVSVARGLLVLTAKGQYQWPTGERDARGPIYAAGPADDPVTAALRIAARYDQIMKDQPPANLVPDSMRNPI